jgi:hypothetical protein
LWRAACFQEFALGDDAEIDLRQPPARLALRVGVLQALLA